MSKIAEQKALEEYPEEKHITYGMIPGGNPFEFDINTRERNDYIKGYDKAIQDVFDYIEAHIPCGELSYRDVRCFINECKNYMQNESKRTDDWRLGNV